MNFLGFLLLINTWVNQLTMIAAPLITIIALVVAKFFIYAHLAAWFFYIVSLFHDQP